MMTTRCKIEKEDVTVSSNADSDTDYNPPSKTATKRKKLNSSSKSSVKRPKVEIKEESEKEEEPVLINEEQKPIIKTKRTDKPSVKKSDGNQPNVNFQMEWSEEELLSQTEGIELHSARNVIRLFNEDNTIPFIARYRKEMTGNMNPARLREIKDAYDVIKLIRQKAASMKKSIEKMGKLDGNLERIIRRARSLEELELIHAPFKTGGKRTLAERAKVLGLEKYANDILNGLEVVDPSDLVQRDIQGLENVKNVRAGLRHIMADIISKDRLTLDTLRKLKSDQNIVWSCTKTEHAKKSPVYEISSKFENYYSFTQTVKFIKPYQILAMNRAESKKLLTIKLKIPQSMWNQFISFCENRWLKSGLQYKLRTQMFRYTIKDAIQRLLSPMIIRQIRSDLSFNAERAAVQVFAENLKQLLLQPPYRGKVVMAIDPGFWHGCKYAIINATGMVLCVDKFYLPQTSRGYGREDDAEKLKHVLQSFSCETIAIGSGTACRETESYLSELIQSNFFAPLDISYTIVSEQGASIYSCSEIAADEFPGLDPNLISAVSIGRRLQDPLAELVKVEPKHLGVGMYQHDIPEKKLCATLDEVVSECVSFVGVDLNTASLHLLKKVAGLNASRAQAITEWRLENGGFTNRQQLRKVKGIGEKTFEQCAGFIRIIPATAGDEPQTPDIKSKTKQKKERVNSKFNPLDRTWIHPESYEIAEKLMSKCKVDKSQLGTSSFIEKVKQFLKSKQLSTLATELGSNETTVTLITEALTRPSDHDLRSLSQAPLFRKGVTSFDALRTGDVLTGRVTNVVHFGAFVDIGVGRNGLIYVSQLQHKVNLGDRVQVRVLNLDRERSRIGLELIKLL